ncbi:MAG: ABC transporter substrate-binding protein [Eubacteriales bacterium]|nr:ABC transporter substrate-binding protein [Eubacteriales bacterium]
MKKKLMALLLSAAMAAAVLTGCGGDTSTTADSTTEDTESVSGGEVEEIVFAYMTQNNIPEATELQRIEDLINAYTEEKINTRVQLVLFSNADYVNQVNLMLAAGEQVDLFQAYNTSHLKYIQDGTALDITDYLDNELKETAEIIYDDFLAPTTVEGRTYGILNMGSNYVPGGFCYREDITEELGIDMTQVTTPEALTEVFAQVKEAYPDMIVIDPNRANALFETYLGKIAGFDPLGDNITYSIAGVAYQDNSTVVNIYDTPEFRDLANLTRSWYQAGYFSADAATTTATTAELLMSGNCFGTFCGLGNPNIAQQYTTNYGYPFENIQISDSMIWAGDNNAWMINSTSKSPSAAAKFMNLLYTDAYVDNLLVYGEEGVDYQLDENECAVAPEGYTDLNSVKYTNNMNYYFWGNKWLTYPVVGGLYGEEKEANMAENYAGEHSAYYGFLFDYSEYEAQYTACLNIIEEYRKSLWVGAADVDTTLEELDSRLKAAGMEDLIAEKQTQLDKWLSDQEQ